jgi:hypothetical protein
MNQSLVLTSLAFSFFVVCPRMAGMIHVVGKNAEVSLLSTVLLGTLLSMPLLLVMVWAFQRFGVLGALGFCILTDFGAVLLMRQVSWRAGLETIFIALFVVVGVKLAPLFSQGMLKLFRP